LLKVEAIDVFYGDLQALRGVSLEVREGEVVTIIGSNGAGKSTTIRSISGILRPRKGAIRWGDQPIQGLSTAAIVELGIVQIPEGRQLFPNMTVLENLELGALNPKAHKFKADNLKKIFSLFPRLEERKSQTAGTLSGGEQQMLAIGRGLMSNPKILMLDEPSLGLSPLLVNSIFVILRQINQDGMTILLVEQNVHHSLKLAQRAYVLENGELVREGPSQDLLQDDQVCKAYLGF
jgi:branched-chain amino acid transport system ATP-binding protein